MKTFNKEDIIIIKDLVLNGIFKVSYDFGTNIMDIYVPKSQVLTPITKNYLKNFKSIYTVIKYVEQEEFDSKELSETKFLVNAEMKVVNYSKWKDMGYEDRLLWIKQHFNADKSKFKNFSVTHITNETISVPTVVKRVIHLKKEGKENKEVEEAVVLKAAVKE